MDVFSWLDSRTLMACGFMLAVAFAIVFFGMKRAYPNLRGINTIAVSFLLFVPGTWLIVSPGSFPYILSVTVANCFVFGSLVFLYRGVVGLIGGRTSLLPIPIVASCAAIGVLFYFSQVQDQTAPRIVAISLAVGLVRGMIALELFLASPTFATPKAMRMFAGVMSLFAAIAIYCGISTFFHGSPATGPQSNEADTATLLLSVVSLFTTGIFILLLASSQLIAASRDESQTDALSGAFNRRGIEIRLGAELMRIARTHKRLSVALVDIDYFKSINDILGHAAGDAALRDVAQTISTHLRGRDYLGRFGGDEFLLVLPDTPCHAAAKIADRLNHAVSSLGITTGTTQLTLSIGLTEAIPGDDAVTLIARADKALYEAKTSGRNCRRVASTDTQDPMQVYRAIGLTLRRPVGESPSVPTAPTNTRIN